DRFVARYGDRIVVDLPASFVAEGCPEADHALAQTLPAPEPYATFETPSSAGDVLQTLLGLPSIASHEELYTRYDWTVGNRTVRGPDEAEAAVQKLPDSSRGYALTITGRGDVCGANPYLGSKAALGAATRNLACVGAEILAITDGLNMGSPTDPVENLRLSQTIEGLADGLNELAIPVTGGNVSLYNESPRGAIPPTPMVGAVGSITDVMQVPSSRLSKGDVIFLLGSLKDTPAYSAFGNTLGETGCPHPSVDLRADKALAQTLVEAVRAGLVQAAKDAHAGGLAVALAKLAIRGGVGADLTVNFDGRKDWALFGEYSGVAWVATRPEHADEFEALVRSRGVDLQRAGVANRATLSVKDFFEVHLSDLERAYLGSSPREGRS
ncbi:MAG: AIR synthase related protein, partial [Myxococcota bacterium]